MRATLSTALVLTAAILAAEAASAATVGLTITILPTAVASIGATSSPAAPGAGQTAFVRQGVAAFTGGVTEHARIWSAADNVFVGFNYQKSEAVCEGGPQSTEAPAQCRTVVTVARL